MNRITEWFTDWFTRPSSILSVVSIIGIILLASAFTFIEFIGLILYVTGTAVYFDMRQTEDQEENENP
jgi:hypothetical protein